MTTIVICDTEPIAAAGLQSLIENVEDITVVAVEASVDDGIDAVRDLSPQVLIVDKSLGAQSVLNWIAGLRVADVPTAVLVWGAPLTEPEAVRFLQAGAGGVIRKTASLEIVLNAILTVAAGGRWMDDSLSVTRVSKPFNLALTAREVQVKRLVERGFKNREIATSLGIQTGTVKIHLRHIFEKTGVRGRYGLALSGLRESGVIAAESPN